MLIKKVLTILSYICQFVLSGDLDSKTEFLRVLAPSVFAVLI